MIGLSVFYMVFEGGNKRLLSYSTPCDDFRYQALSRTLKGTDCPAGQCGVNVRHFSAIGLERQPERFP